MDQSSATFLAGSHAQIAHLYDRNPDATLHVTNLDTRVDDDLLAELFIQCAPVVAVNVVKDRLSSQNTGAAFVELKTVKDADYCLRVLNMVKLHGKPIRIQRSARMDGTSGKTAGGADSARLISANVYIGNLSDSVDERQLQEVFSVFGKILFAKISRDAETLKSEGFGFITFENFEVADAVIKAMDGQFLGGRPVKVAYATNKKEGSGSAAERLLASLAKNTLVT